MNEKTLMRKKKAELLEILAGLGENPSPKTLKKDLVALILKTGPAPEPSSKTKLKKKTKKPLLKAGPSAVVKTPAPGAPDAEETIRAAQLEVEEAKFATEPPAQPDKSGAKPARPGEKPAAQVSAAPEPVSPGPANVASQPPEQAAPIQAEGVPHGESEPGGSQCEPELPREYGIDRITAIARDPEWLFTYWEITQEGRETACREMECESANAKTALRVYDVTGVQFTAKYAHSHIDIEVSDDIGNWYVNTGEPGRTFLIDVGLLGPGGTFHMIARSNPVTMPRAAASEITDEMWMTSPGEFQRIYALSGGREVGLSVPGSLFSPGG